MELSWTGGTIKVDRLSASWALELHRNNLQVAGLTTIWYWQVKASIKEKRQNNRLRDLTMTHSNLLGTRWSCQSTLWIAWEIDFL